MGDGKTALKASYSRYGLQVGIDRVTNVNPLSAAAATCPWTDPNGDGIAQATRYGTRLQRLPRRRRHATRAERSALAVLG